MIIALWVFAIILIIIGGVLYYESKKEIDAADAEDFKKVRSKWQIIYSLIALATIIVTAIAIYLMFI